MSRKLLVVACIATLALTACQQKAPTEPVEPAADTVASAPVETPTLIPTGPANPGSDFDQKGFAGTFTGALPCADCPGIDTRLQLNPDGSFALTETYQDSDAEPVGTEGTWSPEADGQQIRLDPGSKSAQDRLYAITSDSEITQLNLDGQPVESGLDYSLDRTDPAQ